MTVDEFAQAVSRLVAEALDAGVSADQLVDVLDRQSDAVSAEGGVRLREAGDALQGATAAGLVATPDQQEDAANEVRAASRKSVQSARSKRQRESVEPGAD